MCEGHVGPHSAITGGQHLVRASGICHHPRLKTPRSSTAVSRLLWLWHTQMDKNEGSRGTSGPFSTLSPRLPLLLKTQQGLGP